MNESQLSTALAVAEYGSLAKAANALFLSIQGVKDRIDSLERELGCTLFERSSMGMTLIPSGQKFVEKAPALLRHITSFMDEVANPDAEKPVLRIQTPPVRVQVMDEICREFSRKRPDVVLRFVSTSYDRMLTDVRDGLADIGFYGGDFFDFNGLEHKICPGLVTKCKAVFTVGSQFAQGESSEELTFGDLVGKTVAYTGIHPKAINGFSGCDSFLVLPSDIYEIANFCSTGGVCICTEYFKIDFPQLDSRILRGLESQVGCYYRVNPSTEIVELLEIACNAASPLPLDEV